MLVLSKLSPLELFNISALREAKSSVLLLSENDNELREVV